MPGKSRFTEAGNELNKAKQEGGCRMIRSKPRFFTARSLVSSAALFTLMAASCASAQEVNPTTGNEVQGIPAPEAQDSLWQFSYGVGLTTNYISKGLTQTDNGPALQPYAELGYGIGYVGLWASNASFGGVEDTELDVSLGIRPEFGKMSFDLGFVQYFYQEDNGDYGEAYLFGKYAPNDQTTLKFQYYHEVYANKDWLYIGGAYAGLPWDLTVSGGIGTDFGTSGFSEDSVAADIGISGNISDNASYDFRASDSSIEGARFIASLSFYN
jgi:uncharacterized protein (TIGR02001 family)